MSNCPDTNGSDYNVIKHESTEDQSDVVYEISKSSQQSKNKDMIKSEIISDDEQNSSNIISTSNSVNDLQKHNKLYANLRFRTTPDYKSQHSDKMEDGKRAPKTHKVQYELYVKFLMENRPFVLGKIDPSMPHDYFGKKWEELTQKLNSCGRGPARPTYAWKVILANWKSQVRARNRKIKANSLGIGGGSDSKIKLTELEERALVAWGDGAVEGHPDLSFNIGLPPDCDGTFADETIPEIHLQQEMSIPDEIHQIQTVPEDIPEVPSPAEPTVNENTTKTSSRHKKNDHVLNDIVSRFDTHMENQSNCLKRLVAAVEGIEAAANIQAASLERLASAVEKIGERLKK